MAIRQITWPIGITLEDWADQIVLDLEPYGLIEKLQHPAQWQDWAERICQVGNINQQNPPNPRNFAHWQEWATFFVRTLN